MAGVSFKRVVVGTFTAIVGLFVLMGIIAVVKQSDPYIPPVAKPGAVQAKPAPLVVVPDARPEPPLPKTLDEAIARFKPLMTDTIDKTSEGTADLALWCAHYLKWAEFSSRTAVNTRPAKVRKDVDRERGMMLCTPRGRIIEIKREKTGDHPPVYSGLFHGPGQLFHFYAVGSTGELLERDEAKLCGVVTGLFDYHNSGGGIGHAIEIVGMFDLPENRR